MKNAAVQIAELIAPTVEALGLILWGIELQQQGKLKQEQYVAQIGWLSTIDY